MELIKSNLNINFTGKFKTFGIISLSITGLSLLLFLVLGLNYGVDFAGGTEIQIKINDVTAKDLRASVKSFGRVEIQQFEGKSDEYLLRLPNVSIVSDAEINSYIEKVTATFAGTKLLKTHFDSEVGDRIELTFNKSVSEVKMNELVREYKIPVTGKIDYKRRGERHIYKIMLKGITNKVVDTVAETLKRKVTIQRVELVGPKVGKKLQVDAFNAVLAALLLILVYIAIRFDFQFAPGAVAALVHDVLITLGLFALFRIPFDLTIVAALLTIVGYSLNDTIVVYDRIRENIGNSKKGKTLTEKINSSINETLSRTLLTSITTLIVLLSLLFLGGQILRGFALGMTIGVFVGTYSSIFVASPVTVYVDKLVKKGKAV